MYFTCAYVLAAVLNTSNAFFRIFTVSELLAAVDKVAERVSSLYNDF